MVPLTATAASASDTDTYLLTNENSRKCLSIGWGDPTPGIPAIQWDCELNSDYNTLPRQRWTWAPVPGISSTYTLKNEATGKCLAIGGASHAKGKEAIQWTCEPGNTEQQWIYDSSNRLWNNESRLCLAIPDSSVANGTAAIQWTCNDNADQKWDGP